MVKDTLTHNLKFRIGQFHLAEGPSIAYLRRIDNPGDEEVLRREDTFPRLLTEVYSS